MKMILLSMLLVTCQSGKIDNYIISLFKNETKVEQQDKDVKTITNSKIINSLEIPSYTNEDIILKRIAYTTCYDKENKRPNWVAWHLTSDHASGKQKRLSNFIIDDEVPSPRAELIDYKGFGYDRGHMCPAGDNKWAFEPMRESFYLTNVCPQDHNLNCGDWNELEIKCREWAVKSSDIYIVAGPILYKGNSETIGPNEVRVPEAFFKVILCMKDTPKSIGFIYKNHRCNNPQSSYVNSVDEVERITGLDFFSSLPDDVEKKLSQQQIVIYGK